MRFLGFGSLLLGVSVIVSACDRKPTPQEAELLLAKAYKHASVSFNCQEGERDWLYICYVTQHPTSSGMKTPPVRRAGVKSMGRITVTRFLPIRCFPIRDRYHRKTSRKPGRRPICPGGKPSTTRATVNRSA
jgi:hypothetical protein